MPKLSVLLPIYNGIENYPADMMFNSIESILALSTDLELIIIDDASTDGTLEILQSINKGLRSRADKRVTIIARDTNEGQAFSLNRALELASGEYIWQWSVRAFAHPQAIDLVEALDNNPVVGFVYGRMYSYGGYKDYQHIPPKHFNAKRFIERYRCNWYMFRRIPGIEYVEYMETPDGQTIGVCDRDMVMQLMNAGQVGLSLHDTLTVIYYNGGQHTMNKVQEYRQDIDKAFNQRWEHML